LKEGGGGGGGRGAAGSGVFCGCFGSVVGNKFWNSVKFLLIELLKKKKRTKKKKKIAGLRCLFIHHCM